ncbi:hypothetical protein DBV39_00740 [Orrella marina]|uniref:DUF2946 domain-containing protein n=2 Tax=Orrella marina TaxID=2163011 RepID=A0A2R4XFJ4_9BURK|nr:hypothetical protein DBV39_00740 [Orrella marina]
MGMFTRKRQRLFGLWLLTAILLKMVAPAFSHVMLADSTINDRWMVAVCTATGLKYIDLRSAAEPSETGLSGSEAPADGIFLADHCLLCASSHQDVFPGPNPSLVFAEDPGLLFTRVLALNDPPSTQPWPGALPRAPPAA